MKRSGFTIINIIILAVGILFIAAARRPDFIHSLVFFSGIALIVPGVINLLSLIFAKRQRNVGTEKDGYLYEEEVSKKPQPSAWSRFVGWTVSASTIILGAMMCFTPETFRTPLIYIFGIFLWCGALYHLYVLMRGMRPAVCPAWVYAFPAVIFILGGAILFAGSLHTDAKQPTVALLTGIALILFAVCSFMESVAIRSYNRQREAYLKEHGADAPSDASRQIDR